MPAATELAESSTVQEVAFAAFDASPVLIADTVNVSCVTLPISSKELVRFADKAHFALRLFATPRTSDEASLAL